MGGELLGIFGGEVRLGTTNPDPISEQDVIFEHPLSDLDSKIYAHFQTWFVESSPVSVKFIPIYTLSDQNG